MTSKEALNLLSLMRLGADVGLFDAAARGAVDEMFIAAQPAHVQKAAERKLSAEERDVFRADLVRERLAALPRPRMDGRMPGESSPAESE